MIIFGIILMVVGVTIRWAAIRKLKGDFTLDLRKPQVLVTDGIYKHIRHPSYLGSMVFLAGLGLISLYLAFCYLAFAFFLARAIEEECRLILTLNPAYGNYWKRTRAFLPWPKKRNS